MTGTQLPRAPWPWADPFWWAERQFEAAALMMRLTEAVIGASVSSALGTAATATVTAPAPISAPAPVPHNSTERTSAGAPLVPGEAAERAERAPAGEPQVPGEAAERAERAPAGEPLVVGWDELTLGSIRARLRRLSKEDLVALHGYEESHAARPDVLSMLQNRLTKVRSEN